MKAPRSIKSLFLVSFLKVIRTVVAIIFIIGTILNPTTLSVSANSSGPFISANTIGNVISAYNWPLSIPIDLTISDYTGEIYQQTVNSGLVPWNSPGQNASVATFQLKNGFDLLPWHVIKISGAEITKIFAVTDFAVTVIDPATDTIRGIGTSGAPVTICPDNPPGNCRYTTVNSNGKWTAPHVDPNSFSLRAGTIGWSIEEIANGNETYANWRVYDPYFDVQVNNDKLKSAAWHFHNQVLGINWPLGVPVTLSLDKNPGDKIIDYTETKTVEVSGWDPNTTFVGFDLSALTLMPGDVITLSTEGYTKSHTITSLEVTSYDLAADTVSGTAAAGTSIDIGACNEDRCSSRRVFAKEDGNWMADFATFGGGQPTVDIQPDSTIEAKQADINGDNTANRFTVVNSSLQVRENNNTVEGLGWKFGENVTLNINDPRTPANPDYTATQNVTRSAPWDKTQTYVNFSIGNGYQIRPGYEVSLSNGSFSRKTIVTNLAITGAGVYNDTVSGIAGPNSRVDVSACNAASCAYRHVDAGKDGSWIADFGIRGDETDEQTTFDVVSGSQIDAVQTDDDGDKTMVSQKVTNPRVEVLPYIDQVQGLEWTIGETVSLRINDQFIQNAKVGAAFWDASQSYVEFNLAGIYGIQAGDKVSLTDGFITEDTIVTDLEITAFDVTADTVSGKAQPGSRVDLWAWDGITTNFNRHVAADGNGDWKVDFSTPGSEPDEHNAFEIEAGTWIDSTQEDADGNSTHSGTHEWANHQIGPIQAPTNPVKVNQNAAASITFITPEMEVGDTLLWDWGDGTKTVDVHPDMPTVTAAHQYSQPGIYTLTATIYTKPGRIALTEHFDGLVVISPYDGVVLGNGWFKSPGEASPTNPGLGDRADFLFANAFPDVLNAPVGLVIFKAGSLNFVSTTYDWLVDYGAKLQIKGSGTINGKGSYAFLVNASHGQASGEGDKFRIKIWNSSTSQVVYDNQPGAGDFADPDTTIGGGFILIQ